MPISLTDFRVLTFDCYGTLIDWESGIWDAFQPLLAGNTGEEIDRQSILQQFAKAESHQESETPGSSYPQILAAVHHRVATKFQLNTSRQLDRDFAESVPHWPAFADTATALRYLKSRYKLVILSNVHRAGFAASNRKLGVEFDAVYTAEDIGSYKPDIRNFEYLLHHVRDDLKIESGQILHTAQSLFHDHVPAQSFGLSTAWIDRQRLSESGNWGATAELENRPDTDFLFHSMREMAVAVAGAFGDPGPGA